MIEANDVRVSLSLSLSLCSVDAVVAIVIERRIPTTDGFL